jgi:hypothetical protein
MKEGAPGRIANLVARAAPGPLPAVFLVIGTLLLLVGGLAHTGITMRSGVVQAMQCGSRGGNGLQSCASVADNVTVVWLSLGSGPPDIFYDDIYYSGSMPSVSVGDQVRLWTVEEQAGGRLAIAVESSRGSWISDFWHFYDAPFKPETWSAQELVGRTAEPVGVVFCLVGLLAVNRRVGISTRTPVTIAAAGAVLAAMAFLIPIQGQLGLDQSSAPSNAWRISSGAIGAVAALSGAIVILRRSGPIDRTAEGYGVAALIVGGVVAVGLLLAGLALIALSLFFRF